VKGALKARSKNAPYVYLADRVGIIFSSFRAMSAFSEGETETPAKLFATGGACGRDRDEGRRVKMAQAEQQDEIDEIAARFAAMPAFPLAMREYTVNMMRMRQGLRLLNKVISHNARWRVAGFLMYLSADRERFGPKGGATYTNLLEMCRRRAEIKPRVLKTVLALLQMTGSVKVVRKEDDRRSKFYRPTGRMHEFMRQWTGNNTRVLDVLEPEKRRSQLLRDDPGFCDRFLVSSGRAHLTAVPPGGTHAGICGLLWLPRRRRGFSPCRPAYRYRWLTGTEPRGGREAMRLFEVSNHKGSQGRRGARLFRGGQRRCSGADTTITRQLQQMGLDRIGLLHGAYAVFVERDFLKSRFPPLRSRPPRPDQSSPEPPKSVTDVAGLKCQ
jgi:hypothetical protein